MERAHTPVPGLISSLEAMIDASISSALERRLGLMDDSLNVQIEAAVAMELDRRLGLDGINLNKHIDKAVANAIKQRFGSVGSVLNAQIILGGSQAPFQHFAESSHGAVARTTLETPSSTAHKIQTPSQNIGLGIELTGRHLGISDDDNDSLPAGRNELQHEHVSTQRRSMDAETTETSIEQPGLSPSETPAAKGNELELQVKVESQVAEEQALRDGLSTRRTSPADESAPNNTVHSLHSLPHAQSKGFEGIELGEKNVTDESYQAEQSLFVQPNDLNVAADYVPRGGEADSTEKTITQPYFDENGDSTMAKLSLTVEDGTKTREDILPSHGHTLQHEPNHMTNKAVTGVMSVAQRGEDTIAEASFPPIEAVLPSEDPLHPGVAGFAVIVGESEDHHRSMKRSKKGLSGQLWEENSANQTEGATAYDAIQNGSTWADSGQATSAEGDVSLFVEQGDGAAATSTTTSLAKRKADTLEDPAGAVPGSGGNEAPQKKKRTKTYPPGYTEGPQIRYLKVCSQLSAIANRRGYPRVVDLDSFTRDSNKQYFTMADVVATILWNHKAETLAAFLDIQTKPTFNYVRKEADNRRRNFAIERKEEDFKTRVLVGYHARSLGYLWYEYYEYSIEASGRWEPIRHQIGTISSINSKKKIQEAAVALGSEVFQRKVWASEEGGEIVVN